MHTPRADTQTHVPNDPYTTCIHYVLHHMQTHRHTYQMMHTQHAYTTSRHYVLHQLPKLPKSHAFGFQPPATTSSLATVSILYKHVLHTYVHAHIHACIQILGDYLLLSYGLYVYIYHIHVYIHTNKHGVTTSSVATVYVCICSTYIHTCVHAYTWCDYLLVATV